jgi:hypothetical protein
MLPLLEVVLSKVKNGSRKSNAENISPFPAIA